MNPKINGINKVSNLLSESDSKVNANIKYMIIVNDGGTKRVEIIRANLFDLKEFN